MNYFDFIHKVRRQTLKMQPDFGTILFVGITLDLFHIGMSPKRYMQGAVAFSWLARILGECSTIHSLPALFFFLK